MVVSHHRVQMLNYHVMALKGKTITLFPKTPRLQCHLFHDGEPFFFPRVAAIRFRSIPLDSKGEKGRRREGEQAQCSSLPVQEQRRKPEQQAEWWRLRSLKVSVNLEAVVARVGNSHVSVGGEGQTLWAVQRVGWGVDVREEGACAVEHLSSGKGDQWHLIQSVSGKKVNCIQDSLASSNRIWQKRSKNCTAIQNFIHFLDTEGVK